MPILFIDPNDYLNGPNGNDQLNQDDLTISVQLSTQPKSRSVIVSNGNESSLTNINNGHTIYFIEGSDYGDGKFLSTNYSNYKSDNKNSAYDFNNTVEGFGISNIDISFNTSYAPMIKINFIDVRGGVLSRGNTSKYRVFFDLPYPIFKLTVKGYYGKAVTYCLHMIKWNALFNSDTGNFEISAEFIGYTYAMLTDALTGIMRAIPYTRLGKTAFTDAEKRYHIPGEFDLVTIDKMLKKIDTFNETLSDFKQDDNYKKILDINKKYDAISEIKSTINKLINSAKTLNKTTISDGDTFIGVMDGKLNDSDLKQFKDSILNNLKEISNNSLPSPYHILSEKVKPQRFNNVPTNQTDEAIKELIDKSNNKYDKDADKDRLYDFVLTLSNRYGIQNFVGSFYIYDFYKLCTAVNDELIRLEAEEEKEKKELSEKLRTNFRDNTGFDPYIGNIYKVLVAHIEILFKTICTVSNNAENNVNRNTILSNLADGSSYYDVNGNSIYAWPTYYSNNVANNAVTETWLGEQVSINDVDELAFVEDLLAVMLDQKRRDIELNNFLGSISKWNPLSPLDTPIYGITKNPYLSANGKNRNLINPESLMRFLMFRLFYYHFVNKNTLDKLDKDFIPKLEAMNMFYAINDDKLKDAIVGAYSSSDDIIKFFENPIVPGSLDKDTPYITKTGGKYQYSYISGTTANDDRPYQYLPISTESITNNVFDSKRMVVNGRINTDVLRDINYLTNRFKKDEESEFISIISPETFNNSKFDNILSNDEDIKKSYEDTYGDKSENYPTIDSVTNSYSIMGDVSGKLPSYKSPYISNPFNVPTFRRLNSEDGESVASQFYVNTKQGFGLTSVKNSNDDDVEYDNMGSFNGLYNQELENIFPGEITYGFTNNENLKDSLNIVSLFGSPLYYGQNAISDLNERDMAKAFLFINTMPLRGIFGKSKKHGPSSGKDYYVDSSLFGFNELIDNDDLFSNKLISSLFSSNASFIEIPESWIIWVGSILWRFKKASDPIKFYGTFLNQEVSLIPGISGVDFLPNKSELLHAIINEEYENQYEYKEIDKPPLYLTNNNNIISVIPTKYKKIDEILSTLPDSVQKIFINKFMSWATDYENVYGFGTIKNHLEISYLNQITPPQGNLVNFDQWQTFARTRFENESLNGTVFPQFTNKNYKEVTVKYRGPLIGMEKLDGEPIQSAIENPSSLKDFRLTTNYDDKVINSLLTLFSKTSILCNNNPVLWSRFINKPNTSDIKIVSEDFYYPMEVEENDFKQYLDNFINQFKSLYNKEKQNKKSTDELKEDVFQTKDNNDIKLQLYRHLSAINNKWVAGNQRGFYPCSSSNSENCDYTIFESFEFVNKSFQDISGKFPINTETVSKMLRSNWNQSFYDFSSRLLADNNFNFVALPNRITYNDGNDMSQIFKTYSYNHPLDTTKKPNEQDEVYGDTGPRFMCIYAGQPSTALNIGGNNFPDDAINFSENGATTSDGKSANGWSNAQNETRVPVFNVSYGQNNQNIFKNIRLDQSEYTETLESLMTIDDISMNGANNKNATKIGQNLFNVYQTRSYSAEIDALGIPMIQPMMYFQLNDIPIFKGGYLIISTSHNIKPNHMTTKFKGIRQKAAFTPITEDFYAMRALDLGSSQKPTKISIIKNTVKNDSVSDIKPDSKGSPIINKNDSTRIADGFNIYDYNFKNSVSSYGFNNGMFDKQSNTKKNGVFMTYNQIFDEISQKTGIPGIVLRTTSVIESTVGNAKSVKEGKPNAFGYVGLMQFGRPAAVDTEKQLNEYIKNEITASQYSFYQTLFDFNGEKKLKLIPQSDWTSDSSTNNPYNNIFFDDYISTLAMAYYAIKYMNTNPKDIKNVVDVYLTHQQGPTGIKTIKNNPTNQLSDGSTTSRNMLNNKPLPTNDTSKYPTYVDWYLGWAGRIEAIAKEIDPNYESSIAGVDHNTPNADKLRKVLKELGYKEKGEDISSRADINIGITDASIAIFKKIKQSLPDLTIEVTAGNDAFHSNSQTSNHKKGDSIDFIIYKSNGEKITYISGWRDNPTYSSYDKSIIDSIQNILLGFVYGNNPKFRILNEYTKPSSGASGPHIHMTWREDGTSTEGSVYIALAITLYNQGLIESNVL